MTVNLLLFLGKTYTMMGEDNEDGIVRLTANEIFKEIETVSERQFLLTYVNAYCNYSGHYTLRFSHFVLVLVILKFTMRK